MIRSLLLQSWKAQLRSPFWERGLVVNILLALLALYLLANFLFAGYFLDSILEKTVPDEHPIAVLSGIFFFTWVGGLLFRFLMQSFPVIDIQPYLLLPIKKSKLFHYLLFRSVFNVFNLFPLVFILPFTLKVVSAEYGGAAQFAWIVSVMCLALFNNFVGFYLKRQFNIHPFMILGAFLVLGGVLYMDIKSWVSLSDVFASAFMEILQQPLWALVPVAVVIAAYQLPMIALRKNAYLDSVESHRERVESTSGIAALRRLGTAGQFLQMELLQITRNKRPKTMLLMALLILFYPFFSLEYLENGESFSMVFLFTLMATTFPMATYGQFLIAWESSFFNMLMARRVPISEYMKAKYYLFTLFNVATFSICLLYGLADIRMIPIVLVSFLVNMGITAYIILFLSTYNTRPVNAEKSAFMNWEGVGASQFLLVLPSFFLPVVIHLLLQWILGWQWGLAVLGMLGVVGMIMHRPLMQAIVRQLENRKYKLIDAYKQEG
ncbi:MAG: hypothetical protein KI786_00065 [Mameliella sp.]|nr:hypothetical protein [Phaeodactylibacter sp.]